jgi:hypothetical protein
MHGRCLPWLPRLNPVDLHRPTQEGSQGRVRSWVHCPATAVLLLNIKDSRWCGNIGTHHRSNGVYYLVDLRGGTWHQRCYDPDCRHYRSPLMPLPPEAWAEAAKQPVL